LGGGAIPVPAQSALEVDGLQDGTRIILKGPDAGIVFDLLAIKGEEVALTESTARVRSVKVGRDLSCANDSGAYSCEMLLATDSGTVKLVRDENSVVAGAPRVQQAPYSDEFLTISPEEHPGKAKIKVSQAFAKSLFEGLKVAPETIPAAGDDAPGAVKSGAQVECRETAKAATADQKKYDCELLLDLKIGIVDKVEAKPLD
jgi:hypothetical protein